MTVANPTPFAPVNPGSGTPRCQSLTAVSIESIRPSDIVYMDSGDLWDDDDFDVLTKPATPGFESPVLRTRVGNEYLGYVGDVNGEEESTNVVLALLDLLDLPSPIAGPSSRKFVTVLSFGFSKAMEDIFSNFSAELRRRSTLSTNYRMNGWWNLCLHLIS